MAKRGVAAARLILVCGHELTLSWHRVGGRNPRIMAYRGTNEDGTVNCPYCEDGK
jgi:uncharacterized Zn-finger protein